MFTPRLRPAAVLALFILFVFTAGAARAQELARVETPRETKPDYGYLLKTPEPSEAESAARPQDEAETPARAARAAFLRAERELTPDAAPAPGPQASPTPYVPLTSGQKMRRAFKSAFLSPRPYAMSAFSAVLTQRGEDELPDKDFEDEFGDWASRFARNMANRTTRTIFSSGIYPVLFKQDPRYERAPKKGFIRRTGHAISRVFVTRGDNGNLQPNVSRFAGVVTATSLSNLWERSTPGHDRRGVDATLRRIAMSFPNDAFFNVVREFLPDIIGIFRK